MAKGCIHSSASLLNSLKYFNLAPNRQWCDVIFQFSNVARQFEFATLIKCWRSTTYFSSYGCNLIVAQLHLKKMAIKNIKQGKLQVLLWEFN